MEYCLLYHFRISHSVSTPYVEMVGGEAKTENMTVLNGKTFPAVLEYVYKLVTPAKKLVLSRIISPYWCLVQISFPSDIGEFLLGSPYGAGVLLSCFTQRR
jgi:hypothetical protein